MVSDVSCKTNSLIHPNDSKKSIQGRRSQRMALWNGGNHFGETIYSRKVNRSREVIIHGRFIPTLFLTKPFVG